MPDKHGNIKGISLAGIDIPWLKKAKHKAHCKADKCTCGKRTAKS